MVILGLGTNNGDRLAQLRQALKALQHIPHFSIKKISPVYHSDALLPEQAPSGWNLPFLNIAIRCETTLEPLTLLTHLQQIEQQLGRTPTERWAPRCIDIDILAWDNLVLQQEHLTIPHPGLLTRPFALWPLADIVPFWQIPSLQKTAAEYVEAWGSRFTGEAPLHTRQLYQRIETPQLVGAINITPDSFSDGGLFLNVDAAIQQAEQLVIAGAEILDLGAESTSPRAQPIDAAIEWQRLEPVLLAINQIKNRFIIPPRISIDTRHALTAQKALTAGADWINDVSGLDDPAMRDIIAQTQTECVVMHHLAIPEQRDRVLPRNQDPVALVYQWGEERLQLLQQQGISRAKVIFDPGIGFGKMAEQSMAIIQQAAVFKQLGTRLLLGHSRKTFLSLLTAYPFAERDIETTALAMCLAPHVDYLRVHNVEMCARALRAMAFCTSD